MERSLLDRLRLKWLTSYKLNHLRTAADGVLHAAGHSRLILVFGCQRSGTTLLTQIVGLSRCVKNYGEGHPRYFRTDGSHQLIPLQNVPERLAKERNPFTLLKPLCDSQNATAILDRFENAKAIWMFRDYHDCVASHIKYYWKSIDAFQYVQEMMQTDVPCWKNENLSDAITGFLEEFREESFNVPTAYALYWLARNSLVLSVLGDPRVRLVQYEQLLQNPVQEAARVFEFFGVPFVPKYAGIVDAPSTAAKDLDIDKRVAEKCDCIMKQMHDQLKLNQCRLAR